MAQKPNEVFGLPLPPMQFDEFVTQIQALAEYDGFSMSGEPYCDPQSWRGTYEAGLTPGEAWHVERVNLMIE